MPQRTILDFYRRDTEHPRAEHYLHYTRDGRRALSTEQFLAATAALSQALSELGVRRGDRVMLLSDNRPEWHVVDLAVLALGAVDVPVYGTLTPEQVAYQGRDSGAVAAVADGPDQMTKLLEARAQCPALEHLVQMDGPREPGVLAFDDLVETGRSPVAEARFWDRAADVAESSLATLIYTSGTTGEPKGVMLTHHNIVTNVVESSTRARVDTADLALEFLPLCHVLERMVGYIYMAHATTRAYCSVYDVADLLTEIRPTLLVGVPRFFEKVRLRVLERVASAPPVKRALFEWALEVGREASNLRIAGLEPRGMRATRLRWADDLVLSKVREGLGGRLRMCICGGAELPLPVNQFFHALGLTLLEGYGLTETSPVICVNGVEPGMIRLGTVGKPLPNLEVKLAEDGELLVRGPSVMQGYWNKPVQTAEAIDDDGYLHTGDIAEVDDDGFVLIVDRKKDLIVTAGGKNVAPQPIEMQLKQSPLVDTAVLVGDGRPFIAVLFSPNFEELERWARTHGLEGLTRETLVEHPMTERLFSDIVATANASLARYEQIRRLCVLPVTLTIEGGQLTPTLKVKRRVVEQQYRDLIDALYRDAPNY